MTYNPEKKQGVCKTPQRNRKSIRLKGYDYSQAGLYFITICCQNRAYIFGHIANGEMILNAYGTVAYKEWAKTPEIRPHVELGEFVIMPNHIHGIIRLSGRGELHSPNTPQRPPNPPNPPNTTQPPNSPDNEMDTPDNEGVCKTPVRPDNGGVFKTPLQSPSQTIGAIVRGYKSAVTKQLGLLGFNGKTWQRNYWEHIIRNENEYNRISQYIISNPQQWENDTLKM